MKLSKKSDYALRALLHLAMHTGDGPVPVRELAEENAIPRKFLEAIMRELRELGVVESVAGKKGGYVLVRDPSEITIGSVFRHFDGHLVAFETEVAALPPGSEKDPTLRVQRVLIEIGEKVDELLERTTVAGVLAGEAIRYEITNLDAFVDGDGI